MSTPGLTPLGEEAGILQGRAVVPDLGEQGRDLGGRRPLQGLQGAGLTQQIVDPRPDRRMERLPRDSGVELGA